MLKVYMRAALALLLVVAARARNYEVCILTAQRPNNVSYVQGLVRSLGMEGVAMRDATLVDADNSLIAPLGPKMPTALRALADCEDDGNDVVVGVPCKVQQTNLDVVMALETCQLQAMRSHKKFVLFIEDDMDPCPGSMRTVDAVLRDSTHVHAVRFSKFSRAFAIRAWAIPDLLREIRLQADLAPYDLILWSTHWNRKRTFFHAHATNLFHHVGDTSTVQHRNEPGYRNVYGKMRSDYCGEPL